MSRVENGNSRFSGCRCRPIIPAGRRSPSSAPNAAARPPRAWANGRATAPRSRSRRPTPARSPASMSRPSSAPFQRRTAWSALPTMAVSCPSPSETPRKSPRRAFRAYRSSSISRGRADAQAAEHRHRRAPALDGVLEQEPGHGGGQQVEPAVHERPQAQADQGDAWRRWPPASARCPTPGRVPPGGGRSPRGLRRRSGRCPRGSGGGSPRWRCRRCARALGPRSRGSSGCLLGCGEGVG